MSSSSSISRSFLATRYTPAGFCSSSFPLYRCNGILPCSSHLLSAPLPPCFLLLPLLFLGLELNNQFFRLFTFWLPHCSFSFSSLLPQRLCPLFACLDADSKLPPSCIGFLRSVFQTPPPSGKVFLGGFFFFDDTITAFHQMVPPSSWICPP